jgi:hypothetical protein
MHMTQRISVICQWIIVLIGVALMLITVVFLGWTSDRGFDITDEGYYLLSSQFPGEVKLFVTEAHDYASILYRLSFQNVVVLRLAGLSLNLVAAAVFCLGFQRLTDRFKVGWGQTILFRFAEVSLIPLGMMACYVWFLPTPFYNSLNAIALTAGSGLFFLALAGLETLNRKCFTVRLALFAAGLCIGVSFFVKFPTGVSLFALLGLALAVWPRQELKTRLRALGFVVLGLTVWLLFHFIVIQSPATWWRAFRNGLEVMATLGAGHDVGTLNRYFHEFRYLAKIAILHFWKLHVALALGFTILFALQKALRNKTWLPSILILSIFACAVWQSYRRGFYLGGMSYLLNINGFYLSWLMLMSTAVIAAVIYCQRVKYYLVHPEFWGLGLFVTIMFFLPFVGAVGTGNNIFVGTLWYMAPWVALLLILLGALSGLLRNRWILAVGAPIISIFACAQIVSGCLYGPYRLNTDLWGQTQATEIGYPPTILKLDPKTSEFFNRIRLMAQEHGFKPGNDVLGFLDLAGVVFALGGRSPGFPLYTGGYKGSRAFDEKALSLVPPERLKRAFILETSGSAEWMPDLAKFGINFPGDYILCGELTIPYPWTKETVRFWKPRFL